MCERDNPILLIGVRPHHWRRQEKASHDPKAFENGSAKVPVEAHGRISNGRAGVVGSYTTARLFEADQSHPTEHNQSNPLATPYV